LDPPKHREGKGEGEKGGGQRAGGVHFRIISRKGTAWRKSGLRMRHEAYQKAGTHEGNRKGRKPDQVRTCEKDLNHNFSMGKEIVRGPRKPQ